MKIRSNHTDLLELNLAILFISTSGVLGRSIDLPVPVVIFFRALIAGVVLFLFAKVKGFSFKIARKNSIGLIVGGVFLGIHWVTYFYALKLSNVAIGMLSLYTFPTITAVLEPILLKKKFQTIHLVMGLIVLVGIYLLAPDVDVENQYFVGMCLGVVSAVFFSLRNIMLKSRADDNQSVVMMNQLFVVSVLLVPALFLFDTSGLVDSLPGIFLLAILTTVIGHTLFVYSLKRFSTTSASLISSLQPIYGILLAFLFLSEVPNLRTIVGGLVIISTVVIESRRIRKADKS